MSTHMTADTTAATPAVKGVPNTGLLRFALGADAVVTGANGLAYLALGGVIDSLLGIEASALRVVGAFLVVYAAGVALLARRTRVPRIGVMAVVVLNAVWAIDSIIVAAAGWYTPSTVGTVWIVMQAIVVAGFAALQYAGLKRAA